MMNLRKIVKAAEGLTRQVTTANLKDLGKVVKDTVGQMAPTEHQENEENFHPEHKKYFSAPKI